jgi:hypothetical protein
LTHTLIDIPTLQTLVDFAHSVHKNGGSGRSSHQVFSALATAEDLIKNPVKPQVVCNITGGILQGASSNYPVDIYAAGL